MDINGVIGVCLLSLLLNAPRISATKFRRVGYKCTISDLTTAESFFILSYIPDKCHFVDIVNVQMAHLDTSVLNHALPAVRSIKVQESDALSALTISAATTRLEVRVSWTSIREIDLEPQTPVQVLAVSSSILVTVPPTIYRGTALTKIELTHSAIRAVDMALFCNLSRLRTLTFTANKIRTLVNSRSTPCKVYDSLEELYLLDNLLKTISMTLFQPFAMLSVLKLQQNLIRLFAGSFASDMLQTLDISSNRLKTFSLCQWRIPFLTTLSLKENQLSQLPACLDNLKTLTDLTLDNNRLTVVDFVEMAWLDHLEHLYLSGNKIRSLTLNSSDFPMKLRALHIDRNNMTELRLLFVPGVTMKVSAEENQIASFDINATSPKISELSMKGNPMDCSWRSPKTRLNSNCYRNV
ncbi:leucine-rich repeats and immunoglobulin-like domains protein 3 [Anopheles stephensi]|uniref:leucine-rich repeats and immunoglobulin-like domains protein 3 n=1 Tax=Anopheles stephensi TaxID=30069 RepID=UPI00165880B1|nr:leucine-rich repeats and immunoglobulin-like domains protein 3 [Anopheles stephensi]